ncbi:MAG: hypothetical protein Q8S19_03000 [Bacillota bacterium]|nr:hypothetical protein [Bacillota bacterium]
MKNIKYLMDMTKEFLDGKMDGTTYTLDFPYELELRYREMLKENREYAELIYDELIERGTNVQYDENLSDSAFRKIIMTRFKYIKSVEKDGFC